MFNLKGNKQNLLGVVGDSFSLLNKTWAANIITVLVYYIVYLVIQFVFNRQQFAMMFHPTAFMGTQVTQATSGAADASFMSAAGALGHGSITMITIGAFLTFWLMMIFRGILVKSCWNMATSGSAKIGESFKMGLKYFYVYFVMLLIYIVIFLVLMLIVYGFSLLNLNWLTAIVSILAACAFYYFLIKFILVEAATVIEDCGFKAIGRSWCLTGAGWWRTLGAIVFSSVFYVSMLLIIGIGIFLAVLLPGFLGDLSHGLGSIANMTASSPHWFLVLYAIDLGVTAICIAFTLPSMLASTQSVLFNDLKQRCGQVSPGAAPINPT